MDDQIPQEAIDKIAEHINKRNNKQYGISIIQVDDSSETPHYFEIIPFGEMDNIDIGVYAIDGSQNHQTFYNGLSVGMYRGGYLCFRHGKQVRVNTSDDPIILGKTYSPTNILITSEDHLYAIYDELLKLVPVKKFIEFLDDSPQNIFPYSRQAIVEAGLSTLLSFCQEILEWSLVYEISQREELQPNDFVLRDGTLRSLNIKQQYLVKLGQYLATEKQVTLVAITKNSPIKMELNYTFRQIDNYLQDQLKNEYPFQQLDPRQQKLCCWFEVQEAILANAYGKNGGMFARKSITGGRGTGLFCAARLDYVEKLQNYDWLIADVNIFDAIPAIAVGNMDRHLDMLNWIFINLTRYTQEHYILGYPYPLVEVHNLVTLKNNFKEEIINRVKHSMYASQHMDHVDIENLFLDIHSRF